MASIRGAALPAQSVAPAAQSKARFAWLGWAVAAAVVVIAAAIGTSTSRSQSARIAELEASLRGSSLETSRLREAMSLIQAPDTTDVSFGEKKAVPRGRVFANRAGVLLIAADLPALPAGKTYEMWIIRNGKPVPAGLFGSDTSGNAIHIYHPQNPTAAKDVIAVTVEDAAGVETPTSAPIIVAGL